MKTSASSLAMAMPLVAALCAALAGCATDPAQIRRVPPHLACIQVDRPDFLNDGGDGEAQVTIEEIDGIRTGGPEPYCTAPGLRRLGVRAVGGRQAAQDYVDLQLEGGSLYWLRARSWGIAFRFQLWNVTANPAAVSAYFDMKGSYIGGPTVVAVPVRVYGGSRPGYRRNAAPTRVRTSAPPPVQVYTVTPAAPNPPSTAHRPRDRRSVWADRDGTGGPARPDRGDRPAREDGTARVAPPDRGGSWADQDDTGAAERRDRGAQDSRRYRRPDLGPTGILPQDQPWGTAGPVSGDAWQGPARKGSRGSPATAGEQREADSGPSYRSGRDAGRMTRSADPEDPGTAIAPSRGEARDRSVPPIHTPGGQTWEHQSSRPEAAPPASELQPSSASPRADESLHSPEPRSSSEPESVPESPPASESASASEPAPASESASSSESPMEPSPPPAPEPPPEPEPQPEPEPEPEPQPPPPEPPAPAPAQ